MPNERTVGEQMFDAAIKVANANHHLVSMRAPDHAGYSDVLEAVRLVGGLRFAGFIGEEVETRASIAISEASGYSLCDLGA